jgi:hypothetical protein
MPIKSFTEPLISMANAVESMISPGSVMIILPSSQPLEEHIKKVTLNYTQYTQLFPDSKNPLTT